MNSYFITLINLSILDKGTGSIIDLFPGTTMELIKDDNISHFIPGEIIPKSQQQKHVVNVNVLGFRSFDILTKSSGSKYFPLIPNKVGDVIVNKLINVIIIIITPGRYCIWYGS